MFKTALSLIPLVAFALCLGCQTGPDVNYGDAAATETMTIDFGPTDVQLIANYIVDGILNSPRAPRDQMRVYVTRVRNDTDEHIDTENITDKILVELFNRTDPSRMEFLDPEATTEEIVQQLEFQNESGLVDPATAQRFGELTGATHFLYGTITSQRKRAGRDELVHFKFTFKMTEIRTGRLVWLGDKEIRKTSRRRMFGG